MQSVVTGQAPITVTLERKIASGGRTKKNQKKIHAITETNRMPHQTRKKKKARSAYVRIKIRMRSFSYAKRVPAETETEETAYVVSTR